MYEGFRLPNNLCVFSPGLCVFLVLACRSFSRDRQIRDFQGFSIVFLRFFHKKFVDFVRKAVVPFPNNFDLKHTYGLSHFKKTCFRGT